MTWNLSDHLVKWWRSRMFRIMSISAILGFICSQAWQSHTRPAPALLRSSINAMHQPTEKSHIRPAPASDFVTGIYDGITVKGEKLFVNQIFNALQLLSRKDPSAYQIVKNNIGLIKQRDRSGMAAWAIPPTFFLNRGQALYSVTWCAADIAHDSYHAKLYKDYHKKHPGVPVPGEVWALRKAEGLCNTYQLQVMKKIGSPQHEIDHASKSVDTYYWSKDTW